MRQQSVTSLVICRKGKGRLYFDFIGPTCDYEESCYNDPSWGGLVCDCCECCDCWVPTCWHC